MAYRFQKMLESATDQTLVEPNWEGILECVDMIRGGEVVVKDALKMLQKRYHHTNPHISHHALLVLEACVKNCGKKFVAEIATKEFMEDMKSLIISNPPELVRTKLLELIQCWTSAFKGIAEYKIVGDTHSLLKMNGFDFPPIDEAKAMFLAESAPDWAEGENCYRCRAEFGVFTRKHHCRACGQIFCDRCSSKQMLLPQFGIEKKVRVCEACFDKKQPGEKLPSEGNKTVEEEAAREKALKEAQAKEQEELELALAISQSEAEAKEQERLRNLYQSYNGVKESSQQSNVVYSEILPPSKTEPTPSSVPREEVTLSGMADDAQEQPFDSVLAKYLDRDYWERKRRETEEQAIRATAPPPSEHSFSMSSSVQNGVGKGSNGAGMGGVASANDNQLDFSQLEDEQQSMIGGGMGMGGMKQQVDEMARNYVKMNLIGVGGGNDGGVKNGGDGMDGEEEVAETSQICRVLKERVDTMNNRMRSNQLRGRSIVNDSAIHSLFSQLTDLHGTVLQRMTKLEEQREYYERLQDHLAHIQEARQAVNALREENERQRMERLREEQSRRQTQLRQKLEVMRNKKHEMLMTERYAAIQRFQEQERQIRQQRFPQQQQQSPHTVGGVGLVTMPMPPIGAPIPPMSASTPVLTHPQPTTQYQQVHQSQQSSTIASQIPPMANQLQQGGHQQQFNHHQQMPMAQSEYGATAMAPPPQMAAVMNYPGAANHHQAPMMMPAYSMQAPINSQQPPPFIASPQMMYAAAAAYNHPMATSMPGGMPPMQHHQYMTPYPTAHPQYMPVPPPLMSTTHQMPPSGGAATEQTQEQQQKGGGGSKEVPEDLLISFD